MVEMRWLERPVKYQPHELNLTEKVLQYRYATYDGIKDYAEMPIQTGWSEWIDVPTVTEG